MRLNLLCLFCCFFLVFFRIRFFFFIFTFFKLTHFLFCSLKTTLISILVLWDFRKKKRDSKKNQKKTTKETKQIDYFFSLLRFSVTVFGPLKHFVLHYFANIWQCKMYYTQSKILTLLKKQSIILRIATKWNDSVNAWKCFLKS